MNKLFIASLLAVGFFSANSSAAIKEVEEPIYKECSSCKSVEQFQISAKSEAKLDQAIKVYVMNLDKTIIHKFKVTKKLVGYHYVSFDGEPDGRGGRMPDRRVNDYSTTAEIYGVEQKTLNKFYSFSNATIELKESITDLEAKVVPESIAKSAWDLVSYGALQNDVAKHYADNSTVVDKFTAYASMAGKLSNKMNLDRILIEVSFNDDSTAIFVLAYATDKAIQWDFVRGVDVDGNIIKPVLDTKNTQTYRFHKNTETSFRSFFDSARRSGVRFVGSGLGSTGGRVTCTPTSGSTYTCTYMN
ncbi:hypothetical protein [Pseudoalteromonas rhizosphaerae]|uniref:hypothetical protein n=1 Tax=Pseudoalteromonas rhizosphaerae TaxID=2518973 RepID=UPI0012311268|nr:hypothetical protein [Pseudoalteromonas rhizosphaerae]